MSFLRKEHGLAFPVSQISKARAEPILLFTGTFTRLTLGHSRLCSCLGYM